MAKNEQAVTTIEQQDNGKALVTTSEGQYYVPTLAEEFNSGATNFISGLVDDGTPESKAKLFNYLNNNDGSISDLVDKNETADIVNFLIYPVDVVTDDGEIVPAKRTVIVTKEGKTYGSVAEGIFKSLQGLVQFFGMAPWETPIKVQPVRRKTRRGFYVMQLLVITE